MAIFHAEGSAKKFTDEMDFLYLCDGPQMTKQTYLAFEGIYTVPLNHLRAYGERLPDSWDVRLSASSYSWMMKELNMVEGPYQSAAELRAQVKAHEDQEKPRAQQDAGSWRRKPNERPQGSKFKILKKLPNPVVNSQICRVVRLSTTQYQELIF